MVFRDLSVVDAVGSALMIVHPEERFYDRDLKSIPVLRFGVAEKGIFFVVFGITCQFSASVERLGPPNRCFQGSTGLAAV
jgi:hypothetical protein